LRGEEVCSILLTTQKEMGIELEEAPQEIERSLNTCMNMFKWALQVCCRDEGFNSL
jgi:hypothetical protein